MLASQSLAVIASCGSVCLPRAIHVLPQVGFECLSRTILISDRLRTAECPLRFVGQLQLFLLLHFGHFSVGEADLNFLHVVELVWVISLVHVGDVAHDLRLLLRVGARVRVLGRQLELEKLLSSRSSHQSRLDARGGGLRIRRRLEAV